MNNLEHEPEEHDAGLDARKGFLLGCFLHVAGIFILLMLGSSGVVALLFLGLVQVFYMLPALMIARAQEKSADFQKGLTLTAIVVFILNAACFGLVAASMLFSGPWYG